MTHHALVTSEEGLAGLIAILRDARRVALDTETYPIDDSNSALDPRRGKVRLISVAARGAGGVVDAVKVDPSPLLDALRCKTLVAHNAVFDLSFLKNRFGYEHDGRVVDTQVFDAVLYYADGPRKTKGNWKGFPKDEVYRRSLKDVVQDYLGVELDKEEQGSDFGREELTEAQIRYAWKDAEILLPLLEEMMRRLRALGLARVANLEARVTPALAYCQNNGFAIDLAGWREQALAAEEKATRLAAVCDTLAPPMPGGSARTGWNWGSP
ncbi:MAG: hypothetical protein M3R38_24070, partial [Actinomycetota bacterium]|nr:hypothetical protein [Actinomycetota bacterium]